MSLKRADRPWEPACFLFNRNWGLILQGRKSQDLSWRLITTCCRGYKWKEPCIHSIIRLREVYRKNFSFELTNPDQSWKPALSFRSTCVSSTSSSSSSSLQGKSGYQINWCAIPKIWTPFTVNTSMDDANPLRVHIEKEYYKMSRKPVTSTIILFVIYDTLLQ